MYWFYTYSRTPSGTRNSRRTSTFRLFFFSYCVLHDFISPWQKTTTGNGDLDQHRDGDHDWDGKKKFVHWVHTFWEQQIDACCFGVWLNTKLLNSPQWAVVANVCLFVQQQKSKLVSVVKWFQNSCGRLSSAKNVFGNNKLKHLVLVHDWTHNCWTHPNMPLLQMNVCFCSSKEAS